MDFLGSDNLNHWQLWSPLIGWIIIYVGLSIRITETKKED
ncbi:hypothetical protein EV05_0033 [Prochlorococcus sp. MIT 0601]|nr:hypothetical protein EV05_0033 [Prochlorococcus sp. MIT 0601]